MKTRLHPSIILENLINSFVFIILIGYYIVAQMLGDFSQKEIETTASTLMSLGIGIYGIIILVIIILLIIFTIIFWISWKNTYLSFNEESLIIEKGKLFKKTTTIHLKDIATINIKRNILQKILGTSNIKIDLNTTGETYNGKLIFKENKALKLKTEILTKAGKEITKEKQNDIDSIIEYKPKDVFRHMLLSTNIVSIFALIIVYALIIFSFSLTNKELSSLFTILPLLIIIFPIVWLLIKSYLGYYNFKCTRDKDNIRLSYGALTTYKYNIPLEKINTIIIHQTLQARILGYYLIEVVNAGIGSEQEEKTIISLYVKEKEINKIINNIIPEYKCEITLQNGDKNVLKHYLLAKAFWILLSIILCPFTHCLSLILIILVTLIAIGQYKYHKIGHNKDQIIIQNALINKKISITKYNNIELIKSKQKLFSKLYKTLSLQINVVGPPANSTLISGLFSENIITKITKNY